MDSNVTSEGYYHIRSLYYDDAANTAYYANENGEDPREKFRIRMYNNDIETLQLELKRKDHGMTEKKSCALTVCQATKLINRQKPEIGKDSPKLLNQFISQIAVTHIHPVIIVDYDRVPYTYIPGNVRITFDLNMCSSNQISRFLDPVIFKRPFMKPEQHILEVKWDYCLPDFIKQSLQLDDLQRVSISKYCNSRKHSLVGGIQL